VKARDVSEERALAAERRAEIARRDDEVRRATENASGLEDQLGETRTRLQASEMARTNAEQALNRALREAADARAENRGLQNENDRLRQEVDRLSRQLEDARSQITNLQTQYSTASAKLTETTSRIESIERADQEKREREARRRDFAELQDTLSRIATVRPNGNGFVVVLPDTFFVANQTTLALRVKSKMDALGQAVAAHPDVVFTIEGHSDPRPTAETFALGRAQAVADYIAAFMGSRTNFRVESRGSSIPAASSKTQRGRAMNRRVEIVFVGPS
jgi:outer membrane protein OmpA-like peptidoglycan-associated protein